MIITSQNIPSELSLLYSGVFSETYNWLTNQTARSRAPFKLPTYRGGKENQNPNDYGSNVSPAQLLQRDIFLSAVKCWRKQPATGGATPPAIGPRSREWWFDDSLGSDLFYYNYFMQQTMITILSGAVPDWCKSVISSLSWIASNNPSYTYSAANYFVLRDYPPYTYNVMIQNTTGRTGTLFCKVRSLSATFGDPKKANISVNIVADGWAYNSVTWNTQPSILSVYNSTVYDVSVGSWVGIPLPSSEHISLTLSWGGFGESGSIHEISFWGWNYSNADYRCIFV
jgi:hypothetical protein